VLRIFAAAFALGLSTASAQQQSMVVNPVPQQSGAPTVLTSGPTEFKAIIGGDKNSVRLEMNQGGKTVGWAALTAAEVNGLMAMLATVRADLADKVPMEAIVGVPTQDPAWWVTPQQNATQMVGFRHPGYGWLWFQLPDNEAASLAGRLTKP
jgi:hypothetical protein